MAIPVYRLRHRCQGSHRRCAALATAISLLFAPSFAAARISLGAKTVNGRATDEKQLAYGARRGVTNPAQAFHDAITGAQCPLRVVRRADTGALDLLTPTPGSSIRDPCAPEAEG